MESLSQVPSGLQVTEVMVESKAVSDDHKSVSCLIATRYSESALSGETINSRSETGHHEINLAGSVKIRFAKCVKSLFDIVKQKKKKGGIFDIVF